MANLSLRRYDTQARLSVVLSLVSVVTLIGQVVFVWHERSAGETLVFTYGPRARLAILAATGLTFLLAAMAFGLGLSSAGQRRNDKQQLSWIGFFLGAGVLCLTLIVFAIFHLRGEAQVPSS